MSIKDTLNSQENESARLLEEKKALAMSYFQELRFFSYEHLPEKLKLVSKPFCELAYDTVFLFIERLEGEDRNFTETFRFCGANQVGQCLENLLRAKDSAVRASL